MFDSKSTENMASCSFSLKILFVNLTKLMYIMTQKIAL